MLLYLIAIIIIVLTAVWSLLSKTSPSTNRDCCGTLSSLGWSFLYHDVSGKQRKCTSSASAAESCSAHPNPKAHKDFQSLPAHALPGLHEECRPYHKWFCPASRKWHLNDFSHRKCSGKCRDGQKTLNLPSTCFQLIEKCLTTFPEEKKNLMPLCFFTVFNFF